MNEAETRAELIDPALKEAGWGVIEGSRIAREHTITDGRIMGANIRTKQEIADYVLIYRNQKLAVVEAKRVSAPVTEGLAQAKGYARKLQTRFTYSTNGVGIYQVDMQSGGEGEINSYPSPEALWDSVYGENEAQERFWQDRFSAVPFDNNGGQWEQRYYKYNAITKILEAIAKGKDRILLTLATGTGKTSVAFEVAWKLFNSRWNLTDWRKGLAEGEEPTRRPRILFLADRNILADQAFNSFGAFPEDALVRIDPQIIRKRGRVPKNGSVFFTIFQTFMTGRDADGNPNPSFGDYPPDFFDFIVIDECHRGGANDESNWRAIMEYFSPAVQLGLTATPKRTNNVDTYRYFGEPVYVYSLKEGINDGFLTPFKLKQIATTLDEYVYVPDDDVIEGEIEVDKRYTETDFNKIIEIKAREKKRVEIFMREIDQQQKTLVFCATQDHALAVRDLVNQIKTSAEPDYCVRVTANDGERGEQYLRTFQDNEKTIPTILTTSQKLSTGVDARNVRNIVLMRPINSMIEFKQIVGRGTRLFDGKSYFTIYDFVKAYEHFNDPEWDGDPEEPVQVDPRPPVDPPKPPGDSPDDSEKPPRKRIKVKLADGKERTIQFMTATSFWSPDGKPMSAAQFIEQLFGELPALFKNEEELRAIWSDPNTRKKLLEGLSEKGFGGEQLAELRAMVNAEDSDLYDVLGYLAFAHAPVSREERVAQRAKNIYSHYEDSRQKEFLAFVLDHYIQRGVEELAPENLPQLVELKYQGVHEAAAEFGSTAAIRDVFVGFQQYLYEE